FVATAPFLTDRRVQLALLAAIHRIPAIYPWRDFVEAGGLAVSCLLPLPAFAQQQQDPATLPRMQLERRFSGPPDATLIQRLRDPVDGTICYLYLPVSVPRSAASGSVQYGANTIGAISCTVAPGVAAPPARPSGGRTSRPSPSPAPATPLAPPDTPQR